MQSALRIPAMMLWLTVLWIALWGSITWANVAGGLAVAVAVVLFARLDAASLKTTYFRPQWAAWYVLVLAWKLIDSNVRLAYEILTPGISTHTGTIAVPMRGGSEAVINLVANSITLTPGTMTIDIKRWDVDGDGIDDGEEDSVVLYIHGMYTRDIEAVRHDVLRLEALALRAFGNPSDYALAAKQVDDHEALLDSARAARRQNGERS
jgi:multicomponent Na+:H+ antiporter subunit E